MLELHNLLKLTRPLYVTDTETTGVDTSVDRIVQIGIQCWTAEGMTGEWKTLVDPGIEEMPLGAFEAHGISIAQIKRCQDCNLPREVCSCLAFKVTPTFAQVAPVLARKFSNCDYGGKNIRFDLRMYSREFQLAGIAWDYKDARIIDGERLEQIAVPRTLSDLYEKYTGKTLEDAHDALVDVRASTAVIVGQLTTHWSLPRDLDELHELQWPGWLTTDGSFRMVKGVATCSFGKHRGTAMRDIPSGYYNWLVKSDFPEDVKELCRDALYGKFPGERSLLP